MSGGYEARQEHGRRFTGTEIESVEKREGGRETAINREEEKKGRWSDCQVERKDERNDCREGMGIKNGVESDRYITNVQETEPGPTPFVIGVISSLRANVFAMLKSH